MPVFKDRLDRVVADFIVTPTGEAEVIEVLKICFVHDILVTTRGTGTGNFACSLQPAHRPASVASSPLVAGGMLRDPGNILRLRLVTMEAEPRVTEITGAELHRDFDEALRYAYDLAACDVLLLKLANVLEAPIAKSHFQRVAPHVDEDHVVVSWLGAPHALSGWETFTADYSGADAIYRFDQTVWPKALDEIYEYGWNHTTLRALKVDPSITDL